MIKAKVLEYNEHWRAHRVETTEGLAKYVDFTVCGDLGQEVESNPESLIGKEVEYKGEHFFISIAHGVRIARTELPETDE